MRGRGSGWAAALVASGWVALGLGAVGLVACDGDTPGSDAGRAVDSGASRADGGGGRRDAGDGTTDAGAATLGRVLFSDDFESGNLDAWDGQGGEAGKYVITNDRNLVRSGDGALDVTIRSDWSGGQLIKWFEGVDEMHLSMDIMFSSDWNQTGVSSRHLIQLSGNNVNVMRWGPNPDSSFGRAGETPDGTDYFWIHLTPWNDDNWHVGLAHPAQSSMWGDSHISTTATTPGAYQHVVFHCRLDALDGSDASIRLYVDGTQAVELTGLDFRTTDELVFNSVGFDAYYLSYTGTGHIYVDNFVVREGPPAL